MRRTASGTLDFGSRHEFHVFHDDSAFKHTVRFTLDGKVMYERTFSAFDAVFPAERFRFDLDGKSCEFSVYHTPWPASWTSLEIWVNGVQHWKM